MIRVGVTLPQFTSDRDAFVDGARRAEVAGLDSVWVFDHLWPLSGGKRRPILECWTALSYAAAATDTIGVGTLVTRSTLRRPLVVAKAAATVAHVAPDRLTVAIGSGDEASRDENEAFGLPYLEGDERVAQLEATVEIVREELDGAAPVWIAGRSDAVLEVAARNADGWNGWESSPQDFAVEVATLGAAAQGRRVEATWAGIGRSGDLAALTRRLEGLARAGATHLICVFSDAGEPGVYERFGEEVAARLRV
jgi:alkanesulfonate monooxygenase SsuD/methylene tetrahydromethanopterin reductase-like flavin-dependent oxidoreductase (luciferase family)